MHISPPSASPDVAGSISACLLSMCMSMYLSSVNAFPHILHFQYPLRMCSFAASCAEDAIIIIITISKDINFLISATVARNID